MRRPDFGVIGFGRFGKLLALELSERGRVRVTDPRLGQTSGSEGQVEAASLPDTCEARVVVFAVPIRALPGALRDAAPHLSPQTIVADTCSVKVWPERWLRAELPPEVEIVATHPLFGPDSVAEGLADQKVVVVPVRLRHRRAVSRFLESYGLQVLWTTAEEHDRELARTQALTHWIGRGLERIGASPQALDTVGYRRLLEILHYVSRDSYVLFEDMERWNPFAPETRNRFLEVLAALDRDLRPPPDASRD